MFKGFVLSESLSNPTILNGYKHLYIKVEKHNDPKYTKFWHLFKLSIPDSQVNKIAKMIAINIRDEWYAHFWNKEKVCIIFQNKIFWIPKEMPWVSKKYYEVVEYAVEHGINKKYLDFKIED